MNEIFRLELDNDDFLNGLERSRVKAEELNQSVSEINNITTGGAVKELEQLRKLLSAVTSSSADFADVNKAVDELTKDLPALTKTLAELERQIKESTNPQEFRLLEKTINQTKKAITELSGGTIDLEKNTKSLRARLRENTQELARIEDEGLGASKMYQKLKAETAELKDQMGDLSASITRLSSDTRNIDLGVEGVQTAVGIFQTYSGVMALVGDNNKELQETLTRLIAVQEVANGVQQLATTLTNKGGIAEATMNAIKQANVAITSQQVIANRALALSLAGLGIGVVIAGLVLLVANWDKVKAAITGVTREQQTLNDINKEAAKNASSEIALLRAKATAVQSESVSMETRNKLVDELQEKYPKYFGNLTREQILYGNISAAVQAATKAILNKAKASAIESKLAELAEQKLRKEFETREELRKNEEAFDPLGFSETSRKGIEKRYVEQGKEIKKQEDFLLKQLIPLIEVNEDKVADTKVKSIKNTSNKTSKTRKEQADKDKEEFEKYANDYLDFVLKVENELANKLSENKEVSISLIPDDLDQEEAKLRLAFEKQGKIADYEIEKLRNQFYAYLANPLFAGDELEVKNQIEALANLELVLRETRAKELSDKLLEVNKKRLEREIKQLLEFNDLQNALLNEKQAIQFNELTQALANQEITQREYNDRIVDLVLEAENDKLKAQIDRIELEKEQLKKRYELATEAERVLIEKQYSELEAKKNELENKAATETINRAKATAKAVRDEVDALAKGNPQPLLQRLFLGDNPDADSIDKFKRVYDSIKSIIQSSIDIIKMQNQADIQAYDEAIKRQEQRVEKARVMAENGNAEYLQLEEDRLAELEEKRRAAAEKQLAIDSAIQVSQMLVAIAGAAAQIAKAEGIGGVIAGAATIAGVVASGFALINQIQNARPKFYDGTDYLGLGGNPKGKDTIPIMAHEGERIVPSYINEKLKGIKNADLPNYVALAKQKMPKVEARSHTSPYEDRLNMLDRKTTRLLEAVTNLSVNMNVDEQGVRLLVKAAEMKEFRKMNA